MTSQDAKRTGYTIRDPRPIKAENPHSFHLPCAERLAAIAGADYVKALFVLEGTEEVERMWVEVSSIDGDVLHGTLANQPFGEFPLSHGDEVELMRHHVIDIHTTRADDPPETDTNDHLFERCHMDARIDDGMPISRLVRDEPEPADFHGKDNFGWSGWRVEAAGFEAGMKVETYALVVPLRREDGYAHMLMAPPGSVIVRDGDAWRLETVLH